MRNRDHDIDALVERVLDSDELRDYLVDFINDVPTGRLDILIQNIRFEFESRRQESDLEDGEC